MTEEKIAEITLGELLRWIDGHAEGQSDPLLEAIILADLNSENSRIDRLIDAAENLREMIVRYKSPQNDRDHLILNSLQEDLRRMMGRKPKEDLLAEDPKRQTEFRKRVRGERESDDTIEL